MPQVSLKSESGKLMSFQESMEPHSGQWFLWLFHSLRCCFTMIEEAEEEGNMFRKGSAEEAVEGRAGKYEGKAAADEDAVVEKSDNGNEKVVAK
ncbi:uncharacterized protein MONOS_11605 [Monocercomonoides exilis]|uniref:uncharacterized protein n=1 Tax=Monocercomonoides exilis TaxID=2049356 RepID=UPI00355A034D|nr:hypothetical protein MONOS_11605 [Monocercomonoides exilis]|eukprot:MONOS_11605.1-p1 / transcript=MONOS_11605.1 / gene=MONOS_11605 / organism=Monocercomonoides_exilis_PA203 / gene_product=unspecified product / transcript_product=unspecified product / location=Mono_scaffold00591:30839-31203(-) / protein_length=94 / sequence_SO=supercontig / SO=protein_coding / is_pseudo=false